MAGVPGKTIEVVCAIVCYTSLCVPVLIPGHVVETNRWPAGNK